MKLTPRPSNKVILLGKHSETSQSLVTSGFFVLNNAFYFFVDILCQDAPRECQITGYVDIYIVFFEYFFRIIFKCCFQECVSVLLPKLRYTGQQTAVQVILLM